MKNRDPKLTRTLALVVAAIVVVAALGVAFRVVWRADLPNPVATHWNVAGVPDGFTSLTGELWIMLAFVVLLPSGLAAAFLAGRQYTPAHRFLAALAVFVSAFVGGLSTWSLAIQRGIDADQARLGLLPVAATLALAAVVGAGVYLLAPKAEPLPDADGSAPVLPLSSTERVSWQSAETNLAFVALAAVLTLIGVVVALVGPRVAGIALIVAGLAAFTTTTVRVRVDARGASWRLGVVGARIPLDEIRQARPVDVRPVEYGGWGYRLSKHGIGIILRGGPGITFDRDGKMSLTITVPDAATGAAVTNGLVQQQVR